MQVAIVYDRLNKEGGAERVLGSLAKLYPEATWYTSLHDPAHFVRSQAWHVNSSLLSRLPFIKNRHEWLPFLMPFIFESFDLRAFDLVISVGSAECKGVITRPETLHLNYCLTPTRYLWSHRRRYMETLPLPIRGIARRIASIMGKWDLVASTRPDHMISISEHVKKRVKKYYNRETEVIYPPVDIAKFSSPNSSIPITEPPYYLIVSRLVPYKNIELAIRTFNESGQKLVIAGIGSASRSLQKLAKENITFLGYVPDEELRALYAGATGYLQCNLEDFGLAMVEALASGTPVVAYSRGGAGEIVGEGAGVLYNELSPHSLKEAINKLERELVKGKITKQACVMRAKQFDESIWLAKMQKRISELWPTS